MVDNFTPIDIEKFRDNDNSINTVLLLIATLTAFILAMLLFLLIKKEMKKQTNIPIIENRLKTLMI